MTLEEYEKRSLDLYKDYRKKLQELNGELYESIIHPKVGELTFNRRGLKRLKIYKTENRYKLLEGGELFVRCFGTCVKTGKEEFIDFYLR